MDHQQTYHSQMRILIAFIMVQYSFKQFHDYNAYGLLIFVNCFRKNYSSITLPERLKNGSMIQTRMLPIMHLSHLVRDDDWILIFLHHCFSPFYDIYQPHSMSVFYPTY